MTNRLEFNWTIDGVVDEQRYYCSETLINVNSLPSPKAVLSGAVRTYTDTAVTLGKSYYVIIGSVKNGVQKLSSQKTVTAGDQYWSSVTSLLHFNGANNSTAFTDQKSNTWTRNGTPIISTEQSKFGGSSGRFSDNNYIYTTDNAGYLFGSTEDFTIEAWLYIPVGAILKDNLIPIICAGFQDVSSGGGGWNLAISDAATATMNLQNCKTNGTVQNAEFTIGSALSRDVWHHIEFGRAAGTTYGFFNGNLKGTTTDQDNVAFTSPNTSNVSIGSGNGRVLPNNWHLDGFIDELRITKGVCRHTASFTPPIAQLPDK